MTDAEKKKMLQLILEYGDNKFREGSAAGLGDRDTSTDRGKKAAKVLESIKEVLK